MRKRQLDKVLAKHRKWQKSERGGKRADLALAYLAEAKLVLANLVDANLVGANLSHANLAHANLAGADLTGANLTGADLTGANLTGTFLGSANLLRANLARADLRGANFKSAFLGDAYIARNKHFIGCSLGSYQMVAFMHKGELRITCGCRRGLTVDEAREYWSPKNIGEWTRQESSWGKQRLRMIDFLEAEAKALEWI